jgi:4-aminobutyrate aminotransferase/(S)-3-amino-2-methylpropionate transaminase
MRGTSRSPAFNALTPGDHDKRTALFNSGAGPLENAIEITRAYVSVRPVFICVP